jgi:hypothetical protein
MRIAFRNIESQLGRRENPPSHKSQRHRGLVYSTRSSAIWRMAEERASVLLYLVQEGHGEGFELVFGRWVDAAELRAWLTSRDRAGPSGDVYAVQFDRDGTPGR